MRKGREPHKHILTGAHRQGWESILAIFHHKRGRDCRAQAFRHWPKRVLEELDKVGCDGSRKIINGRDDEAQRYFIGSDGNPLQIFKRETGCRKRWTEQQDVVGINHRSIGSFAVRFPDWAAVKIIQRFCARGHIRETSGPNEAVLLIKVSKLTDDFYPHFLLRFD